MNSGEPTGALGESRQQKIQNAVQRVIPKPVRFIQSNIPKFRLRIMNSVSAMGLR